MSLAPPRSSSFSGFTRRVFFSPSPRIRSATRDSPGNPFSLGAKPVESPVWRPSTKCAAWKKSARSSRKKQKNSPANFEKQVSRFPSPNPARPSKRNSTCPSPRSSMPPPRSLSLKNPNSPNSNPPRLPKTPSRRVSSMCISRIMCSPAPIFSSSKTIPSASRSTARNFAAFRF